MSADTTTAVVPSIVITLLPLKLLLVIAAVPELLIAPPLLLPLNGVLLSVKLLLVIVSLGAGEAKELEIAPPLAPLLRLKLLLVIVAVPVLLIAPPDDLQDGAAVKVLPTAETTKPLP